MQSIFNTIFLHVRFIRLVVHGLGTRTRVRLESGFSRTRTWTRTRKLGTRLQVKYYRPPVTSVTTPATTPLSLY